ncbi:unnamed protein product [Musa acuminata var. zebrina]
MAEASELLQKLSLDSPPKTHDALLAQQGSSNRESSNMETPSNRSPTPLVSEFADPNMFYVASGYASPAYLYGGYDGSVNEWDLYQGYAYTPYGTYPFNGSSIPAMAHDGRHDGSRPLFSNEQHRPPTTCSLSAATTCDSKTCSGVRARVAPALASRMFPANRSSGGRRYGYGFDGYGCRVGGRLNFR